MNLLDRVKSVIKICRLSLLMLNSVAIVFALYFMISHKNLVNKNLVMAREVLIGYGVITIIVALLGIGVAVYGGKHKKRRHYRLAFLFAILATLLMVSAIIVSAIYVRNMTAGDIVFTVLLVLFELILLPIAFGYPLVLKKVRTLKRLNLI
ncbi:uncharacterized protein LOC128955958 [Oppia nitens]|uniref:uncharacterized protein LOC128955958 n=1 Tax=Oppia nitens TaxID=1686743 RepID=UPI0023DBB26F|nr:uncharacterized protein LOC128955958 [Oppia nitens]